MAQTYKITVDGPDLKGSSLRWKDSIEGLDYKHGVTHQFNAATGGSAGERAWEAAEITIDAHDPAVIGFLKQAVTREKALIPSVKCEWPRVDEAGTEVMYLTCTMKNVLVHKVQFKTPEDVRTTGTGTGDHMQAVICLIFAEVHYESVGGKAMDDAWAKRGG